MSMDTNLHDYYLDGAIAAEIAENYKSYIPDHEDLTCEEFLLQQGSVYSSFKERGNQSNSLDQSLVWQGVDSPRGGSFDSEEALDAALARSLEELGDDFDDFQVTERTSATEMRESSVEGPSRESGDTENVGVEKKGVSKDIFAMLPTFKYKRGFFSKKKENDDCMICLMAYNNGDQLTTLPCFHQYHLKCIAKWLKCSKSCPVCKKEVGWGGEGSMSLEVK